MSRSVLLDTPGAVAGDGADAPVAAHYGDPMREQRLLVEGLAAVDLSHRDVLTVTGQDRTRWLHSLTTQWLTDLPAGESREALILSPTGHIEHALHLVDDGDTTWITTEPGTGTALAAWLESMQFLLRVQVRDVSGDYAVIGEPSARAGAAGEPVTWVDPWPGPVGDTACYGPETGHPGAHWRWREVVVPRGALVDVLDGRPLAGLWALDALRIAAWRPRLGPDTDHRSLVHELDWLRTAVHLRKGCYRGQETVARVHNLGRPPRRLVHLHLDGSGHALPSTGAAVTLAGRQVGRLGSVGRHYLDGPIALAVVKRATDPTATFDVDGVAAAQTVIVEP